MTPSATTPAAKATTKKRPAEAGHRRTVAPPGRQPRRVSGPTAGPAARTAPPVRAPKRQPARGTKPPSRRIPRRVSGPATRHAPLPARALAALQALPDHRLVDRLVRGRAWIPVLGLMLAGIVAMQVEVLKLGANMGRYIERGTYLQGRNESLRENVAALADDQRIERLAAQRGMVMPAPSDIGFLSQGAGAAVAQALANIRAPAPITFLTTTSANGAVVNGQGQAAAGDTGTTGVTYDTGTSSGTATATAGGQQTSLSGITSGTSAAVGMADATGTSATSGSSTAASTASPGSTAANMGTSSPTATGAATTTGDAAAGTAGATGSGASSTR